MMLPKDIGKDVFSYPVYEFYSFSGKYWEIDDPSPASSEKSNEDCLLRLSGGRRLRVTGGKSLLLSSKRNAAKRAFLVSTYI